MRIGTVAIAITSILAIGCVGIRTDWKVEPDSDVTSRKTFQFESLEVPTGLEPAEQKTWAHRHDLVRELIRSELTSKGYAEASENPDMLVHFYAASGGYGVSRDSFTPDFHYDEPQGTIDIWAMDPATKKWLWHGWATETLTKRLDVDDEIRKAVPMVLVKFPPAS